MPRVILLSGPKFSGKSRFVEKLARELAAEGLRISGFFQRGVFDEAGKKIGYDLVEVAGGTSRSLARISEDGDRWVFDDDAFAPAAAGIDPDADLLIIDEAGPLELSGKGHRQTLELALGGRGPILLSVREELAETFTALLAPRAEVTVLRYSPGLEAGLTERIRDLVFRR